MNHQFIDQHRRFLEILHFYGSDVLSFPVSVRFVQETTAKAGGQSVIPCLAMLAVAKRHFSCAISPNKESNLCSGGRFFLGADLLPIEKMVDVYCNEEHVFENAEQAKSFCQKFYDENDLKIPLSLAAKTVYLTPLKKEVQRPDVVVAVVNAEQANRLIGLSVYQNGYSLERVLLIPGGSTCSLLYLPKLKNQLCLTMGDYYDRFLTFDEKAKKHGWEFWNNNDIVISMTYAMFCQILEAAPDSPHGLKIISSID